MLPIGRMRASATICVVVLLIASLCSEGNANLPEVHDISFRGLKNTNSNGNGNGNGNSNTPAKEETATEDDSEDDTSSDDEEESSISEMSDYVCKKLKEKNVNKFIEYAYDFVKECTDTTDDSTDNSTDVGAGDSFIISSEASEFWDIIFDPAAYLSESLMCQSSCLDVIYQTDSDADTLYKYASQIFDVCAGVNVKNREAFLETVLPGDVTWEEVIENYEDLREAISDCAPSDLDEETRTACQTISSNYNTYLATTRGTQCSALRANLTTQAQVKAFCVAKKINSCEEDIEDYIKKLVKAGCDDMDLVTELRADIAGVCDTVGNEYCYPTFQNFTKEDLYENIETKLAANDTETAQELIDDACDSKCFRKVAKEYDLWSRNPWGLDLLCKGDNSCFLKFLQALMTDDDTERAELVCGSRCFNKIARSIIASDDISDDVKESLKAMTKYLCLEDSEDTEDTNNSGNVQSCLSKVSEAEANVTEACADVYSGTCSSTCKAALPGWVKNNIHTCCISTALNYRAAVWDEDAATSSAAFWSNLTAACEITMDETCSISSPDYRRRRGFRLCGISASLLNTTEALDALTDDILAAYGITEDNLLNLSVQNASSGCSNTTSSNRRMLSDVDGAEVTYDLQGQSDDDVDNIVSSRDSSISFDSTTRVLPDAMSGVTAEEYEADTTATPSAPSSASTSKLISVFALAATVLFLRI